MISLHMLPDNLIYREYDGDSGRGNTFKADVTVEHVRFERTFKVVKTEGGEETVAVDIVLIDADNTSPQINLVEMSEVEDEDGNTYTIKQWTIAKMGSKINHWVVMLT